jgi:Cu-Zn family superoxide dismutase
MRTMLMGVAAAVLLCACQTTTPEVEVEVPTGATAELKPTKGNRAFGEATFDQVGDKVRMVVFAQNLRPGEQHDMRIHEAGDCSSGDGMSARAPYIPAGNLPPLKAGKDGRARAEADLTAPTLKPGTTGIVGRSLIVYGGADARITCGVIRTE